MYVPQFLHISKRIVSNNSDIMPLKLSVYDLGSDYLGRRMNSRNLCDTLCDLLQMNAALTPGSLEFYVTAVKETFTATNQPTTLSQGSAMDSSSSSPGSSSSSSPTSGGRGIIGNALTGIENSVSKVVSGINTTFGSFADLGMLAGGVIETAKCGQHPAP